MLLKVEGGQFVKDTNNKALLTVNPTAIQENEARKKLVAKLNSKNDEINKLNTKVDELTNDISDIKTMLKQLIKN
jgi:uncharacterized protein YlxW (UPF0749 family)